MKKITDRKVTELTLKALMAWCYRNKERFAFEFDVALFSKRTADARAWLIHFLRNTDVEKLTNGQLMFILSHVVLFTGEEGEELVQNMDDNTSRTIKVFILKAIQKGVYLW